MFKNQKKNFQKKIIIKKSTIPDKKISKSKK